MRKNIYCTLDTETVGGASCPQGVYHLAGIIHDRQGNILDSFNYVIEECYKYVNTDNYAKKNFYKYAEMIKNGEVELVKTEFEAIELVNDLLLEYDVKYLMAYNSGFDFEKTVQRNGRTTYNNLELFGENGYIPVGEANAEEGTGQVYAGFLEQSNVSVVDEMVQMIAVQRNFDTNQWMITTIDDTLEKAVNQIGTLS